MAPKTTPPAKDETSAQGRWGRLLGTLCPPKVSETTCLIIIAALVGAASGLGAVGFIALLKFSSWLFLVEIKAKLGIGGGLSLILLPLIPALGGLIVGPLVLLFPEETKGLGVPEVIESSALRGGVIRPRTMALRALAAAVSIGSGGSAGREGPIAQICAAIGSTVGQLFQMSGARLRLLVGCGTASGIAAAFNAPLAGVFFALEIVMGEFTLQSLSPILVASVAGTAVSRSLLGQTPAFAAPSYRLGSAWEIAVFLALGLICAVVARAFVRLLYSSKDWFEDALPRVPRVLKPALGGLMVGCAAVFFPDVLGNGYETLARALHGSLPLYLMALLIILKMGATAATLGSGGSGGIIAPSLFVGAMVGGAVGSLVNGLLPAWTAPKGAYALAGMGAVMAAATHSPLTNILLLFELTDGFSLIVPVAAACLLAYAMARRMDPDSAYTWKLTRRGITISRGVEVSVLGSLFVRDVMEPGVETVPEEMSFRELRRLVEDSRALEYPVVDAEGRLRGLISLEDLGAVRFEPELQDTVLAKDLASPVRAVLKPSDNLQRALDAFGLADRDQLPVVSDDEPRRVVGTLRRQDILAAYERAVVVRRAAR